MIGIPINDTSAETQSRNGLDHKRVYDPGLNSTMKNVLKELRKMNIQLSLITGEEV